VRPTCRSIAALLLTLGGCAWYAPQADPTVGEMPDARLAELQRFHSLASAYIDWTYSTQPVWATNDGIHDFDGQFGLWSKDAINARVAALDRYQLRLLAFDPADLDPEAAADQEVLKLQISAARHDLTDVRSWEKNPNFYRNLISSGLYSLAALAFDTPERRMVLATERLRHSSFTFEHLRESLRKAGLLAAEAGRR
jgi:uncharacterized protein (DUF885 family)